MEVLTGQFADSEGPFIEPLKGFRKRGVEDIKAVFFFLCIFKTQYR